VTLAQRRLQGTFYQRLAREGHSVDDLHRLPDGTFLDTGIQRPTASVSLETLAPQDVSHAVHTLGTVFDTPEAEWWRLVGAEVHALPRVYPRRRFLVAWAQLGDVLNAARSVGLTRKAGRHAVRKFLRRLWAAGKIARVN